MRGIWIIALFALAACGNNFTPREKVATYDAETHSLVMPYPCPDWSQSQTENYANEQHSNFGCAVNGNLAAQLDNPEDLVHGHGISGPDTEMTTGVIQAYRKGDLPKPLTPLQSTGTGQ